MYALHIPLDAAWDYSFKEYFAVIDAATSDTVPEKKGDFDEEELAMLERMRQM